MLLSVDSCAQGLAQKEQVASQLLTDLRSSTDDSKSLSLHAEFKKAMAELVRSKDFFDYPLQSLKIADLRSSDESVRLLTWNVELSDLSNTYGGFVLHREEGRDRILVLELTDVLDPYSPKPENTIDQKNWYGAVYYKIIDFSFQGKTQYLLFGYDGGTTMSNFKILCLEFFGSKCQIWQPCFQRSEIIEKTRRF